MKISLFIGFLLFLARRGVAGLLRRLFLSERWRGIIFHALYWTDFSEFISSVHLPEYLADPFMVQKVKTSLKTKKFEQHVSAFLIGKYGKRFIDVGANIGYYSFLLHDNFDEIFSIEPHPRNIRIIRKTKKCYGYHKVKVLPFAIGDKNGEEKLYLGHTLSHHGESSLLKSFACSYVKGISKGFTDGTKVLDTGSIKVKIKTLDSLLNSAKTVDLIKVDVEGGEWKVLDGAKNLMNKIRSWLIELHNLKRKQELEELMRSFGYEIVKWIDKNHIYAERD